MRKLLTMMALAGIFVAGGIMGIAKAEDTAAPSGQSSPKKGKLKPRKRIKHAKKTHHKKKVKQTSVSSGKD